MGLGQLAPAFGLARVSHTTLECGELRLRVSVAPPLDSRVPPKFVLYVLGMPPPRFFGCVCCTLL